VIGAAYAACQLLKSQEVPSKTAWGSGEPLNYVLVATGVTALIFTALVFYGYSRTLKRNQRDEDLLEACKGAWHRAVRELGISQSDMDKIAAHVWSVRGWPGAKYLHRRATFKLRARSETQVLWRKGKGAIGVAWARGTAIIASVENLDGLAGTEEEFCQLDPETRYGLSWSEFSKVKHYRAILAIPLETRPDHVAGCLSIDVQLDGYSDRLDTLTDDSQLSAIRDVCEKALR
jgi:hypothetical protein